MHSVTGSLNKNWISKKGKIEEKISNFHGEESNCCRVDELAVVCHVIQAHHLFKKWLHVFIFHDWLCYLKFIMGFWGDLISF